MKTLDQFAIAGRSALVTGAASGIGLAYAECMAEAGAKVTLADIDAPGAEREAARLRSEGADARAATCDVSDLAQVAKAFDGHVAAFGGLDICFANAGWDAGNGFWSPDGKRNPAGQIDVYDAEAWQRSIAINLSGAFHTVREAVRCMKAAGRGGSIIATASNAVCSDLVITNQHATSQAKLTHSEVVGIEANIAEFQLARIVHATGLDITRVIEKARVSTHVDMVVQVLGITQRETSRTDLTIGRLSRCCTGKGDGRNRQDGGDGVFQFHGVLWGK